MKPIAHYWLVAASSRYAKPQHWMAWADRIIEHTNHPSAWLADVSIADSNQKLKAALQERLEKEERIVDPEHHNALLGYLLMRYKEGTLTLPALLQEAGEASDSGPITVECEKFYALLNRLEKAQTDSEHLDITNAVEELFAPFFQIAKNQWDSLGSVVAEDAL
jgi:hypothetical protein